MNYTEIVGMSGSICILISMCFNTTTTKGEVYMRALNFVGSIIYILYGVYLNAFSTIFLNIILAFVNVFYFVKAFRIAIEHNTRKELRKLKEKENASKKKKKSNKKSK